MENKKILVVDDEENVSELLKLYLEAEGFVVNVADNGLEALELAVKFKPDLIILDIMLPYKDGWQVFAAYVTSTDFNYIKTDFKNDVQFNEFINSIREKSLYVNDTIPNSKDIILTLSTCSYEFEDARLVVHFKLIK